MGDSIEFDNLHPIQLGFLRVVDLRCFSFIPVTGAR